MILYSGFWNRKQAKIWKEKYCDKNTEIKEKKHDFIIITKTRAF